MEHLIFHHNGREYTIYNALRADEITAILAMGEERDRRLNSLNHKSTRKYFEDTDKMVAAILRKCFQMTDRQISSLEESDRRSLVSAFIKFLRMANSL